MRPCHQETVMFINVHPDHLLAVAHEAHRARVAEADSRRLARQFRRRVRGRPLPAAAPDYVLAA